ncbi:type II toxin-antitoxin system RelE/ParE family toxin [Synoicihabitans lomoniglobus]|uniref:Type II toxin-antitoxin system RelE/ParE family toxin n=1 Tax=Synoicihabitans lomoniglobus TaxID=2909285 RepID=A0AAE9ZUN3_9BACT|nr:type II toxin-antitoxin system RelE/ParE family toxin [Opitutaceae bacterium LMO-M01]WED63384.1 type II toxin-antitoxin system RelE/ParE family toxin [Opitutaceae bacterium LMO-M01]
MDYRVILAAQPELRDLREIARFIAQDSPAAAERGGHELLNLAESLTVLPSRGVRIRSRPGARRRLSVPYLVVYRVDETARVVKILRFWHAKRNPDELHLD